MRPNPLRINRTPSRMRTNGYFFPCTMAQKTIDNATSEAQSLPKLDKTSIQENTKINHLCPK